MFNFCTFSTQGKEDSPFLDGCSIYNEKHYILESKSLWEVLIIAFWQPEAFPHGFLTCLMILMLRSQWWQELWPGTRPTRPSAWTFVLAQLCGATQLGLRNFLMNLDLFTFSSPCVLVSSWHNTILPMAMASVEHFTFIQRLAFLVFLCFPLFLTAGGEDRKGFDKDDGEHPLIF